MSPEPSESVVLKDFRAELKRQGMEGESFTLEKGAVTAPRNRRVETVKGVKITFPATLQSSVISIDEAKGKIVIQDKITLNDVDLQNASRPRA